MADASRQIRILYGAFDVTSVAAAGGQGTYTVASTTYIGWVKVGMEVRFSGFSVSGNNGTFVVVSVTATTVVVTNASAASDSTGLLWYEVGGGSTRHHMTAFAMPKNEYVRKSFSFDFVIADTSGSMTDALWIAEEQAALDVFRTPRRDCVMLVGTALTEVLGLRHSTNTAFDGEPSIEKIPSPSNTVRSSAFRVTISFENPADNVGTSGLRLSNVSLSYTPSRRATFSVEGVFTALPTSTTARAAYNAAIGAFVTSVASVLGITSYELVAEGPVTHNSTNKTLTFSRTYRQLIYSQAGSTDDSAIVEQHFHIKRRRIGPGDTPQVDRLVQYLVSYDCSIDKTVTTDLSSKWESTIKPWIMTQIQAISGGSVALVMSEPDYDYDENRITAGMEVLAAEGGGLLEQRITTAFHDDKGATLTPVWNGGSLTKFLFQGPQRFLQTVTSRKIVMGSASKGGGNLGVGLGGLLQIPGVGFGGSPGASFGANIPGVGEGGVPGASFGPGGGGGGGKGSVDPGSSPIGGLSSVIISEDSDTTPLELGTESWKFSVTEVNNVTVREFYVPAPYGNGNNDVDTTAVPPPKP